ncbi:unnamed protein product, partial [Meganyctiphanes norvegica]
GRARTKMEPLPPIHPRQHTLLPGASYSYEYFLSSSKSGEVDSTDTMVSVIQPGASEVASSPPPQMSSPPVHAQNGKWNKEDPEGPSKVASYVMGTCGCVGLVLIALVLPIAMIVVGSERFNQCAYKIIPIYLIIGGIIILVQIFATFISHIHRHQDGPSADEERGGRWHRKTHYVRIINLISFAWMFFVAIGVFYYYQPGYDPIDGSTYCEYGLYMFAFWLPTLLYIIIGVILISGCCIFGCTMAKKRFNKNKT